MVTLTNQKLKTGKVIHGQNYAVALFLSGLTQMTLATLLAGLPVKTSLDCTCIAIRNSHSVL